MTITLIIVLLTVVVSIAAWQSSQLMQRLMFYPPAIEKGQVDRLFTHGFIHADGMHLFFNMFTLYSFGRYVEPYFEHRVGIIGFVLFYFLGIIIAILPSFMKHRNDSMYSSLGASGAVSAVVFSSILMSPWSILYIYVIPVPAIVFAVGYIAYSVWADKQGRGNVNHSAHLVGAVYGMLATILVEPSIVSHFIRELSHPRF